MVDKIPCYEDAVIEIFCGHRKRDGEVTVQKCVSMKNFFRIADYFMPSLSIQSDDVGLTFKENIRIDEYNQTMAYFSDFVKEAFEMTDEYQ